MLDKKEFLRRLRAGESAEALGNEVAEEMNEAMAEFHKNDARRKEARGIVDALTNFLSEAIGGTTMDESEREQMTDLLMAFDAEPVADTDKLNDNDILSKWLKSLE